MRPPPAGVDSRARATQALTHDAEDAKKAQKAEIKSALKALSLAHEPPAFVADGDCDAVLTSLGLPALPLLSVKYDAREVNKAASFFSKTKAAHRCGP